MSMEILRINNVSKSFKTSLFRKKQILHNVSLALPQKSVMGFLGPNGAGKSTLIKTIMDFIRPDNGTLQIAGKANNDSYSRGKVGFLPEHPYYYDNLTANELLLVFGKLAGMSPYDIKQRGDALLTKLHLIHAADKKLRTYSKGMQQRVGFALAIIHDPDLLILDEPLSGLDPMGRHMIIQLITDLKNEGKSIFFSSHILNDIERVCDLVAIINRGKILFQGNLQECIGTCGNLENAFVQYINRDNEHVN